MTTTAGVIMNGVHRPPGAQPHLVARSVAIREQAAVKLGNGDPA